MIEMSKQFEEATVDVEFRAFDGDLVTIPKASAFIDRKTGDPYISAEAMARAEVAHIVKKMKISGRDLPLLAILYARPANYERGYVCEKYRLNKMLFYIYKRVEKEFSLDLLPHDTFVSAPRGPIPKNLWTDIFGNEKKGIFRVKGNKERQGKEPLQIELTPQGEKVAEELWKCLSDDYKAIITEVKTHLTFKTPDAIMKMVHKEFPEFKGEYTEPDTGDIEGDPTYPSAAS